MFIHYQSNLTTFELINLDMQSVCLTFDRGLCRTPNCLAEVVLLLLHRTMRYMSPAKTPFLLVPELMFVLTDILFDI